MYNYRQYQGRKRETLQIPSCNTICSVGVCLSDILEAVNPVVF